MTSRVELVEIRDASELQHDDLQGRARMCSKNPVTQHYKAMFEGQETAFVALDRIPANDALFFYELFVSEQHRRKGIGSCILREVELLAAREGFSAVKLRPRALSSDVTDDILVEWYRRCGYEFVEEESGVMAKSVGETA